VQDQPYTFSSQYYSCARRHRDCY